MAGSSNLYELIGSLSKTEKRYCRLMLETGAGRKANSCLRLFQILSAMPEIEEPAVRAAVEHEPFAGHLSVTKNHLYEHLLRSLRAFSASRTRHVRIRALIEDAELLSDRGLYAQARDRLCEAREMAERFDYPTELLMILRTEWRFDVEEGRVGVSADHLAGQRRHVAAILDDVSEYWDNLHAATLLSHELVRRGPGANDAERGECEELCRKVLELPPPTAVRARRLRMKLERGYYMLTARYEEGYHCSLKSLRFVESFPLKERMEQLSYLSVLYHHTMMAVQTCRFDEARCMVAKIESLEPADRPMRDHKDRLLFCSRIEILMGDFDHEAIAALAGKLDELCRRQNNGFIRQIRIGYVLMLSYAQFVNGHMKEAMRTLHPLINDYRPGFRDDALCIARLYQLMIHYDLGNIELLPYLVRSTYRFISRVRSVTALDRAVLRFIRRLPGIVTQEELVAELRRARQELTAIAARPGEREASAIAYFLPWLDSKITGRSFGELARESRRRYAAEGEAMAVA